MWGHQSRAQVTVDVTKDVQPSSLDRMIFVCKKIKIKKADWPGWDL
jgi:hypothetical protein